MQITFQMETLIALSTLLGMVVGLIVSIFKLWARFHKLERGAEYRQEDAAMGFMCHKACLVGINQLAEQLNVSNDRVKEALRELDEHLAKRAAGMSARGHK